MNSSLGARCALLRTGGRDAPWGLRTGLGPLTPHPAANACSLEKEGRPPHPEVTGRCSLFSQRSETPSLPSSPPCPCVEGVSKVSWWYFRFDLPMHESSSFVERAYLVLCWHPFSVSCRSTSWPRLQRLWDFPALTKVTKLSSLSASLPRGRPSRPKSAYEPYSLLLDLDL